MAMVDTHQTINGCKVWFEHPDADKARREAGNYKVYLAGKDVKQDNDGD